jgi:glutamate synthase (NADPH/NADH) small chain
MSSASLLKLYKENFAEIVPPLKPEEARIEANRCLYCYDAPCIQACPTHIDIPRFIKQIASENLTGSAKTILEANAMGHSCARVCPVEVLCEGACVYHDWQEKPISIGALQRRATDHLHKEGLKPFRPGPDNGLRVAVVGGGPSGLSCAVYLRRLGYAVTLFEKRKLPGGLNTYGVAEYKMDQDTSLAETRMAFAMGVDVVMGKEVGKDIPAHSLLKDFQAVYIALGLGQTNALRVPGEDLPGVWDALGFIHWIKARNLRPLGRSAVTVVIGAGNTSIDAVTQSKRAGAGRVIMAYRRSQAEMGAYGFEHDLAKKDGAEFLWNAAPVRILGKKKVEGIEFQKTALRRGKLALVPGSKFKVPCDRVIKAIGQNKLSGVSQAFSLALHPDGRIKADPKTLATSNSRVFAGGDAVNGGKEVVNAAADGKRAAWGIHRALQPGVQAPSGNEYWISTIDGRKVAPIPPRGHAHG